MFQKQIKISCSADLTNCQVQPKQLTLFTDQQVLLPTNSIQAQLTVDNHSTSAACQLGLSLIDQSPDLTAQLGQFLLVQISNEQKVYYQGSWQQLLWGGDLTLGMVLAHSQVNYFWQVNLVKQPPLTLQQQGFAFQAQLMVSCQQHQVPIFDDDQHAVQQTHDVLSTSSAMELQPTVSATTAVLLSWQLKLVAAIVLLLILVILGRKFFQLKNHQP
ncbi:MAG: hypothetical protein GF390_01925 [Candidatus Pacebacteria bacterium]|nr:hypothetical protein [Candidatus Paceibacterota bacterium]